MNKDRVVYYSALIFCILGGGALFFIFMRYILAAVLPFLIAWGVAFAVRRPAMWIAKKTKISVKLIRAVLAVLGMIAALALGFILIWQTALLARDFLSTLDGGEIGALIDKIGALRFGIFGQIIPEELSGEIAGAFKNAIASLIAALAQSITRWISALPRVLIFIVISLIASIYFSLDLEGINKGIKRLLPERIFNIAVRVKDGFLSVGLKYMRAYALIILITFALMLTGLSLLRIRHAPMIALIIAVLDILPVLGVGTVLVPWSIFALFGGDTFLGVGLLILLTVNVIIRQISEPRIVGKNLDLHPALTLVLLYSGYTLFGLVGLILLPLSAVIINILGSKRAMMPE